MKRYKEYIISIPHLMAEWNWEENNKRGLDPNQLTLGSGQKVNWICSKGHTWDAAIAYRVSRKTNCPYCSNSRLWIGYNDLKSQHPELLGEWDYETNTVNPSEVVTGSNKVVSWICPKGHKYTKAVCLRVAGQGCKICARAFRTSFPEQCFFYYTKKVFPDAINGYKDIFKNQMELDIYIPSIKTGIEYDGLFWHNDNTVLQEQKKFRICEKNHIRLFRIKEGEFDGFKDNSNRTMYIPYKCDNTLLNYYIADYLNFLTGGCKKLPIINIEEDKKEILEYKKLRLEDSFAFKHKEIAKEWHPTKNGKLTPDLFTEGSPENVWWKCAKCGNEWKATIGNRSKGHGCNLCAEPQRRENHKKTILARREVLNKEWCLKDWDYELNAHTPEYYTNGSGDVVNWHCHKCGYKWKAAICDRTRDYRNGCPLCSRKIVVKGINDITIVRPALMQEWDYEKNKGIDPATQGVGSRLNVSWICQKCGYGWEAQTYNRANGKGCPCCANRVVVQGINDLATTEPELAKEWHPTLNTLKPTEVTRGQSKMIYWKCSKCGNVWQDTLNHRSGGRGCSICKKKKKTNLMK